jgi:hypothetical protein
MDIGKVTDFDFKIWKIENLEKSEKSHDPLVSRNGRLNGSCQSPVHVRMTPRVVMRQ